MILKVWRIRVIAFIVYAPTNSGLSYVRAKGLRFIQSRYSERELDVREVRGESIPQLLNEAKETEFAFGIVGEDLLWNYRRSICGSDPLVIDSLNLAYTESYASSVFGLPTLCLIGKEGMSIDDARAVAKERYVPTIMPQLQGKRIAIPARYSRLIQTCISQADIEWVKLDRKVDVTAATDQSIDYAVDIVLTGKTCKEASLGIYAVLCKSDGVILGSENVQALWRKF